MKGFIRNGVLLLAVVVVVFGCVKEGKKYSSCERGPKIIEGFSSPESVASDNKGKMFFVSNVGEELLPSTKDGDGFISLVTKEGKIKELKYLPAGDEFLDAPKGMVVVGKVLYVTDIDRVVGYNIKNRKKVFELDMSSEGSLFLNDLVVVGKDTLLVSATDIGKIYIINTGKEPSYELLAGGIPYVNGLYFDPHSSMVFVVSFGGEEKKIGDIGVIDLASDKASYKVLKKDVGQLDGVALIPGYGIVISDWVEFGKPGRMLAFTPATGEVDVVSVFGQIQGPADFFYDSSCGKVWIP
ncbi:MAG: hypothetical protein KAR06_06930, partial [Deltaproteobacteria bacterium]|nr:hypothetical protein [Deltaproteobacteria bacterium]